MRRVLGGHVIDSARFKLLSLPLWPNKNLWMGLLTVVEPVWTGPCPNNIKSSLKKWETDRPMNRENPRMNNVLKLLRLQNWRRPSPADAAHNITETSKLQDLQCKNLEVKISLNWHNIKWKRTYVIVQAYPHNQREHSTMLLQWAMGLKQEKPQISLKHKNTSSMLLINQ